MKTKRYKIVFLYDVGDLAHARVVEFKSKKVLSRISNLREKITKRKKIKIKFDYPLQIPVELEFKNPKGFTLYDVYKAIYDGYKQIYKSYNKYGVWGHYIDDLVIAEFTFKNGKIKLYIDS